MRRWRRLWRPKIGACSCCLILARWIAFGATEAEQAYARALKAMEAGDSRTAVTELELSARLEPGRAEFHYAHAIALTRIGAWSAARAAIGRCLRLNPNYPGGNLLAGEIESGIGNRAGAASYFEKASKQDPANASILSSLGLILAELGRFDEAAAHFRSVTKLKPGFAGGHYNLGLALLNLGDASNAEKAFRKVLSIDPAHEKAPAQLANSILAQAQKGNPSRMSEVAEAYRIALDRRGKDPELHFNLAFVLGRLGDDLGAMTEYREVVRLRPDYPTAQFCLGFTLFRVSDWLAAEKHFREALAQGQNDFSLHYYLGSTLVKTGKPEEAERRLQAAARLNPEDPGPHFQLAALCRSRGDTQRARTEQSLFRELAARQEVKWRADALQGVAKSALEQGNLDRGINALRQAFETRADAVSARNLALAHLRTGNTAEARSFLKKALELSPNDAVSHNYMGLLEAREGHLALARNYFENATKLDPALAEALYNLGVAALELGETTAAIRHFEAALAQSDTPRIRQGLAAALLEAGRLQEAQKHFDAAQQHP